MTIVDEPRAALTFNAREFAKAWRSVAIASGKDKEQVVLDRTIAIEFFHGGAQLVATDGYILLRCWVGDPDAAPGIDIAPAETVVARDPHGRAKGLCAHLMNLTQGEDAPVLDLRLSVGIDDEDDPGTFGGLDRECVMLEVPDQERLKLPVVEAAFPQWRGMFAGWTAKMTDVIALNPEVMERLAKLGSIHGDGVALRWAFGGAEAAARVSMQGGYPPSVHGLVMPVRVAAE